MNINDVSVSGSERKAGSVCSGDDPPRTISKDAVFHLLQNSRRRAVLRILIARGADSVAIGDIADQVAAWENDTTVSRLSSMGRQRVYIALYQSHLPKLDDHAVITYDRNRGTVSPLPLLTVFVPYLDSGLGVPSVLGLDSNSES